MERSQYKMYRTQCVLVMLSLYLGLVHSFSWEIVTLLSDRLEFYDINGTKTHTENLTHQGLRRKVIYDPVHDRVLFSDGYSIFSFEIATKQIESIKPFNRTSPLHLAYDPVTELLFWSKYDQGIHSISLKPGLENRRVEQFDSANNGSVYGMNVDICGGFIHWIENSRIYRARFNGTQREEIVPNFVSNVFVSIDQKAQKMYWYDMWCDLRGCIKFADLNGENTREVYQIKLPQFDKFAQQELTFSKDHVYWQICPIFTKCSIWKIPKNTPSGIDVLVESNFFVKTDSSMGIAAKYSIEDVTREVDNCERVKSLLPNSSVSNVTTDESLHCVHGTKVSGESRCECAQGYSGERCDVSV